MNASPFKVNVFMVYRRAAVLAHSSWTMPSLYRLFFCLPEVQRIAVMIYFMIYLNGVFKYASWWNNTAVAIAAPAGSAPIGYACKAL